MGVGKSSLGREVAARLGLSFVDLDEEIAAESGMSIPELFAREGEPGFRKRESQVLERVISETDQVVIATGGGAFVQEKNRDLIRSAGISVWLDAPADVILARGPSDNRPLWKNQSEARALLERRRASYRLADIRFELNDDPLSLASERLYQLLASYPETA